MAERETVIIRSMRRRYNWPEGPLNLWLIVMFAAGAVELGIFIYFMVVQSRLQLGIPWYVSSNRTIPRRNITA